MPSKFNFDSLRKFLPAETFNILNAPPKDELADLGQRELPFPEEVDFLPAAAVEAENFGAAQSEARGSDGYFESLFGPPRRQLQIPGLEAGLTPEFGARQSGTISEPVTPHQAPPTKKPWLDSAYGAAMDATTAQQAKENSQGVPKVGLPPPEMVDRLSGSEYKTIYGDADPVVLTAEAGAPEASPWMSEGRYRQKPLEAAARVPGDRTSFLEDPSAFRTDPMEVAARTPKKPVSLLADPVLEKAVHYGQDTGALPAGRYEEYPLPGGRGAKFVPQSPSSAYGVMPEPGIALPGLSESKRRLEDLTGEGMSQTLAPTGTPLVGRAKLFSDALVERVGLDETEIQPIWDRIQSNHFRDPVGAEREFVKFASAVLKAGKDPAGTGDPQRRMAAHFAQAAPIARGNSNEGFGERVSVTNKGWIGEQLEDSGDTAMPQGFRGSEFDAEARQEFNPKAGLLDVEEETVTGNKPLSTMTRKPGLTDDPVENFLKGVSDIGVVPKGTLQMGLQRVQGKGLPSEVEVVKITPLSLSSKPGYLKAISKRSGIPLRNLQLMVDAGQELEIVQVKQPSGKVKEDLPPEGRWRDPKDLKFWNSEKGQAQKARLEGNPKLMERLLQKPSTRMVGVKQGFGKDHLAVIKHQGKDDLKPRDYGVAEREGKISLDPMDRILGSFKAKDGDKEEFVRYERNGLEKVRPREIRNNKAEQVREDVGFNAKNIPANTLEADPLRGRKFQEGVHGGTDPRDKDFARSSEGEQKAAPFPEKPGEEVYTEPRPIEVEGLQLSPTSIRDDFSKVKFSLASSPSRAKGGSATLPEVSSNPGNAQLTLVFTPRSWPSNHPSASEFEVDPNKKTPPGTMMNPTAENIREVLGRSNISRVVVKVEEPKAFDKGPHRGPAAGAWERVKAILKEVKKPKGDAGFKAPLKRGDDNTQDPETGKWYRSPKARALLAGGLTAAAGSLYGADEAEAAPRTGKASFDLSVAFRDKVEPPDAQKGNVFQEAYTDYLDQFEPVYRGLREFFGKDSTKLQDLVETKYGGSWGDTAISVEPAKLAIARIDKAGLTEQFNRLLTTRAGLRQWDVVARKRDAYMAEALALRTAGRMDDSRKAERVAKSLNDAIAGKTVWEQNLTKEDLSAHMAELQAEVGPGGWSKMEAELPEIYGVVQAKMDEMATEGLIDPISLREYKARGLDYIPTWKTHYEVDEAGRSVYTGNPLKEVHAGTTLQMREEDIIQEVLGSIKVMQDPLDNVANFVARGTQEIYRNQIAKGVVEEFGPGVAIRHKKPPTKSAIGNAFYHFMENGKPVTYEVPTWLVEHMSLVDKRNSDAILGALPGNKTLGATRAIAEAGVTTINVGFVGAQAAYDTVASLMQNTWNAGPLTVMKGYVKPFFRELVKGYHREWVPGTPSSPLRKAAGKAGVLGSGASSRAMDPRDVLGRKGLVRAQQAKARGDVGTTIKETSNWVLEPFARKLMLPVEEASKLASWELLQKLNPGMSQLHATAETRRKGGSVDWAKDGRANHYLRAFVTFGRPAIMGVDMALQAAQQNPKKMAALAAGMMSMELARQSFNQFTADQTGESLEDLEKRFSDFDTDNTYLVMIPPDLAEKLPGLKGKRMEVLSNGTERPFALKLPLPPIVRLYKAPFAGMAKAFHTGNLAELPLAVANEMVPGTVPFESDNLLKSTALRVGASLPAPLRAMAEQVTNTQFFTGAPIVGRRIEDLPLNEQHTESTSPTMKGIAQAFGETPILGSPARLDHLSRTFLPGALQTPVQVLDKLKPQKVAPVAKGELERLKGIPGLGSMFFSRIIPQSHESELAGMQDDFYELYGQTKGAAGAMGKFEKGILDEPSKLVQLLGEANPDVSALVRELSQLSTVQKQIVHSPDLDSEQKRAEIKNIVDEKRTMLRSFLSDPTVQLLLQGTP